MTLCPPSTSLPWEVKLHTVAVVPTGPAQRAPSWAFWKQPPEPGGPVSSTGRPRTEAASNVLPATLPALPCNLPSCRRASQRTVPMARHCLPEPEGDRPAAGMTAPVTRPAGHRPAPRGLPVCLRAWGRGGRTAVPPSRRRRQQPALSLQPLRMPHRCRGEAGKGPGEAPELRRAQVQPGLRPRAQVPSTAPTP